MLMLNCYVSVIFNYNNNVYYIVNAKGHADLKGDVNDIVNVNDIV